MANRCAAAMIALLAGLAPATAEPSNPKATFYSEKVLHSALADIAQMPEAELRVFTHYLAECQDERDAAGKHACSAAKAVYEIEYGNERALDNLIFARSMLTELPPDVDTKDPAQLANAAIERAKVITALHESARARFRRLKASQK